MSTANRGAEEAANKTGGETGKPTPPATDSGKQQDPPVTDETGNDSNEKGGEPDKNGPKGKQSPGNEKGKQDPPPPPVATEPKKVRVICEGTLGPLLLEKGDITSDPRYLGILKNPRQKKVEAVK
jgi:hypothetical protein